MSKRKPLSIILSILILLISLNLTDNISRYHLFDTSPEPVNEIAKVAKAVDAKQLACMAKNIFYEANGESIQGQAAVARVVMNRINHGFGSNPCNVIYQATYVERQSDEGETYKQKLCQFSWVCEGKGEPNKNSYGYLQANQIAYDVLAHDAYKDVISKSTLYFHNTTVTPNWPYSEVKKIGNHVFYSKQKNKNNGK